MSPGAAKEVATVWLPSANEGMWSHRPSLQSAGGTEAVRSVLIGAGKGLGESLGLPSGQRPVISCPANPGVVGGGGVVITLHHLVPTVVQKGVIVGGALVGGSVGGGGGARRH